MKNYKIFRIFFAHFENEFRSEKILNRLSIKSDFVKNAFSLTIGTSISQTIPLLFYPILSRIFTPTEFGLFAIISSITSIIAVLSSGRYEGSILITETKKDAADIIGLVLILSFTILLVIFLLFQLFSNQISLLFNTPLLKNWLFVCPLSAFAIIIYFCYNEWCVRNKYFINLSWNKITNSGSNVLGKLFFGIVKVSSNGLVIGDFIGRAFNAGLCIFRTLKKDKDVFFQMSLKNMKVLSKRYIEFPKYLLPGTLLNTVGGQLPIILIGVFFNSIEVGYFAMTTSVLSVPSSVISAAIKDTFRQRANDDFKRTGHCRSIFIKTFKILATISLIGVSVLWVILPKLFSLFLGEQWRIAGEYSQILVPMIALSFVSNSLSGVLIIAEKMKVGLLFQIYYLFITFVSLGIGYWVFHSVRMTLGCYTIGMSSAYLLELYLSLKYSKTKN